MSDYFLALTDHYKAVRARLNGSPPAPAPLTIPTGWDVVEPEPEPEPTPLPPPRLLPPDPMAGAGCAPDTKAVILPVLGRHSMTWAQIVAYNNKRAYVRARSEVYVLLRTRGWSYLQIARLFGRDHTTIVNSVQRYEKGAYK
ncbi:Chromosomal replication initiator, DnaA C-terminal [uncultured Caudovirales phage]|uniref:Chromosomal replication initiator, DnaA C-terminal n=1 Tax=uncultured Caudovirales phage TaxID=2100421 RepID=A0A6J7WAH7_9CAUD|nr:Chromosomal replication initiator, DnaA C-terminal [uncultured Caudovirales phage]CAB5187344.1 Chromosomal replication initiator, DnaA C-terminal [uncultured Caudovirales phage]